MARLVSQAASAAAAAASRISTEATTTGAGTEESTEEETQRGATDTPTAAIENCYGAGIPDTYDCVEHSCGIHKVHRIILHISIAIERLRVGHVVAAVIWVGLVEARMPAIVATEHGFVRAIRVPLITREFLRLKGGVTRMIRVRSPWIQLTIALGLFVTQFDS